MELALAEIRDVAVSADNHLFLALMFAGLVQKYTGDGEFVANFGLSQRLNGLRAKATTGAGF